MFVFILAYTICVPSGRSHDLEGISTARLYQPDTIPRQNERDCFCRSLDLRLLCQTLVSAILPQVDTENTLPGDLVVVRHICDSSMWYYTHTTVSIYLLGLR